MGNVKLSRSFRCEGYNETEKLSHNNRDFIAKNVDRSRIENNIFFVKEDIEKKYEEIFGQALQEYNAKKTKTRDKIENYYEHIKNSKQEKSFYEIVVQFGDMENCAVGSDNGKVAQQMLEEYMNDFQKRNPNLIVFNAVMHLDECTPHLHIDFIPIARNQTRGLSTRVSFSKALEQQGIKSQSRAGATERILWGDKEREVMESLAKKYNIEIENKFDFHTHVGVDEYKEEKERLKTLQKRSAELSKKNTDKKSSDFTEDDIDLIRNENELIKVELSKREKEVRELSKKLSASFSYIEIPDDQKAMFISDTLRYNNIPVIEDTHGLFVPDYAVKDVKEVAKKYKPKMLSYRPRLKLTIDRLVYSVDSIEELYSELCKRGYVVRDGKHISVRPEGADRSIRTKSLGDDYTKERLIERIAQRKYFEQSFNLKHNLQSTCDNPFAESYVTVTKTVISMIYKAEKEPKKLNSEKSYTMENDFHINELVNALSVIERDDIRNINDLNSKIESLQNSLDDMSSNAERLKRLNVAINEVIKAGDFYYANKDKPLDYTSRENLKAAEDILTRNKVTSVSDIEKLKLQYKENQKAIAILKEKIPKAQARQTEYLKISDSYEMIVNGSYIDKLIHEELEKKKKTDLS